MGVQTVVDDDDFAVLNAVYLRKIATPEGVAEACGLPVAQVANRLAGALSENRLEQVGGMYMLSETGTVDILGAYRRRYENLRTDPEVLAWYDRFEGLNRQFLPAISAWQTDGGADRALDRLLRIVDRLVTSLAVIGTTIGRYRRYADRLRAALDHIEQGATEYVTSPTIDSLHTIWFEFHEDILTVIGGPRDVAEAAG